MPKLEEIRKFIVALVGGVGGIWVVVTSADLSTKAGVYTTISALVTAVGVYLTKNAPKKTAKKTAKK